MISASFLAENHILKRNELSGSDTVPDVQRWNRTSTMNMSMTTTHILPGKVDAKAEYQQVVRTINKHQLDVDLPVCCMYRCLIHKAKDSGFYLS